MRIELVFPKFKLLSGAERLILALGSALRRRGHRVRVVCHQFDATCRPLAAGLEIVETGTRLDRTGNHYLDSILGYGLAFGLRRAIDPEADAVCLFGPALPLAVRRKDLAGSVLYFCYEPPRAAGIDREDILSRVGGWRPVLSPALRGYRAFDRWLVRKADGVLVNGEFGRQRVREEYGLDATVVTHGVDLTEPEEGPAEARRAVGLPVDAPVALTVNFLHPRKRVDLLLRAWREVESNVPGGPRLLVVGDGPEASRLRRLASQLGLRGVGFRGFVPEDQLPLHYRAASVLVHAARQETFGLTILEAAALGVPAVVVDEGGPRETVLDGETGLRVEATAAGLAGGLRELLGNPGRTREMGEAARDRVRVRYTWDQGAGDFLSALHDKS